MAAAGSIRVRVRLGLAQVNMMAHTPNSTVNQRKENIFYIYTTN
jgi:hypothetical protein